MKALMSEKLKKVLDDPASRDELRRALWNTQPQDGERVAEAVLLKQKVKIRVINGKNR